MKDCRWLKPVLVGQFEFREWTPDNHLRHSRFVGHHDDKRAREVLAQGGKGNRSACDNLPTYTTLKAALETVVNASGNAGLSNEMWATVVNREAVSLRVFSATDVSMSWASDEIGIVRFLLAICHH